MSHSKSKRFLLPALLCLFLSACGSNAASQEEETQPIVTDAAEEEHTETEYAAEETAGESSAETGETKISAGDESGASIPQEIEVPSVTPVENLSELLFERDSVQDVMVVIDRRLFDDITVMTNEEEKEALLDELYAADLSTFEDTGGKTAGGNLLQFKLKSGESEVTLAIYDGIDGITDGTKQYLRITDSNRLPLAEIQGPKGTFQFSRLDQLRTEIVTNTEDPLYSGAVSIPGTGYEAELDKGACGYALYFFDTALENAEESPLGESETPGSTESPGEAETPRDIESPGSAETAEEAAAPGESEPSGETASFDVRIQIGETVYQLESATGYFSREKDGQILYGTLDEQGLFMILHETHISSQLPQ